MRLALIAVGIATGGILMSSGCSHSLGTVEVDTDGSFAGLMYKNCGCGCTAVVDVDAEDGFNAGGKTPLGADTDIGITVK